MAIDTALRYGSLVKGSSEELFLDPHNPRLGAEKIAKTLDPDTLLDEMRDWELEELAVSFLESGFWPQEALLVVKEKLYGETCLVVVEGNRRLAALKYLQLTAAGKPPTPKWKEFVGEKKIKPALFEEIPYLIAGSRGEVSGYLGFRHVSGIKEWDPPEKAAFIAKMIDEQDLTYEQVMRRIGSKTEPVRRNYISHRILLQMQEHDDEISLAVLLIVGFRIRETAVGVMLFLFAFGMNLGVGVISTLDHSVYTACAASFILALHSESAFSIDSLLK